MSRSRIITLTAAVLAIGAIAACSGGTEPKPLGAITHRIIEGKQQAVRAGTPRLPERVKDEVARLQLAQYRQPTLIERLVLPPFAHAQSGTVKLANAVMCVPEKDESGQPIELVPLVRCVNTDANGNATWVFLPPTKAGAYKAPICGQYGNEPIVCDTAYATVAPGPASPSYTTGMLPSQCSPAELPIDGVRDQYGNAVPYRIVSDGRLVVLGDTVGTKAARSVTFTAEHAGAWYTAELRDSAAALVGRVTYRISVSQSICPGKPQIDWSAAGTSIGA